MADKHIVEAESSNYARSLDMERYSAVDSNTAVNSFVKTESSEGNELVAMEHIAVAVMYNIHRDDKRDSLGSGQSD